MLTNLLHDYLDPMFISDKYFAKFFKDNEKRLENSFVFLMADHGHRISGFAKTKMGGFESNNPSLMMTVPKALRSNKELMKNLRDNANKHKSHFDTYATMLDIITEAGRTGFKNLTEFDLTSVVQSDTIKGKSLFRPIHEEDRDCYSMNIPSQFCLCEPKFSPVEHVHQNILNALKSAFVTELNMKLDNDGLRLKCAKMVLNPDKPFIVEYVMGKSKRIVFKITATTLPGNAEYKAFINENMKLEDSNIIRLNHYAEQAEVCEKKSTFRRFCYCKSLIKTIS
uniref:Sulfatase domain-containing protein n=1 Tax=Rhabditophanes sp. KR3021 TaxID=114890 RepID=A0AC35UFH7_9BILA